MQLVLKRPDAVTLKVTGTEGRFPVGNIYCVGRNYADHVKEMGDDPARSEPIIFTKAPETLVQSGYIHEASRMQIFWLSMLGGSLGIFP